MNHQIKHLLKLQVACITIIFLNGWYRCKYNQGNDALMKKLPVWDLDGWSLTHFFWYMYLGYLFPNQLKIIMMMGVMWELWEQWYGENAGKWLIGKSNCNLGTDNAKDHKNWWYGKSSDIVMNFSGFMVGKYLNKHLD